MLTHVTSTNRNGTETEPVLILNTCHGKKQLQQEHIVSSCKQSFWVPHIMFFLLVLLTWKTFQKVPFRFRELCRKERSEYDGCLKTRIVVHESLSGEFNLTELDNNHLSFFQKGACEFDILKTSPWNGRWAMSNSWWHDPFLMGTSRCISFAVSRHILYHRYGGLFEMMLSNSVFA